jgi:hypothetical protein
VIRFRLPILALAAAFAAGPALASSHMDAPLITLDDAANTTDVYAYLTQRGDSRFLQTALAVYPFEEPGIGPNKHNFGDDVLYEIHVSIGDDLAKGRPTISYQFDFSTRFKSVNTILQSYTDVVQNVDDDGQNLTQTYTVRKIERGRKPRLLGTGIVPPNNQGNATPFYNQGDDGENPAKDGVSTPAGLDRYTSQSIASLQSGYRSFAGQRDDGFYADIQSIFDLLSLRSGDDSFDSQGGFNVHTIALEIPVAELGGDQQVVGVYATSAGRATRSSAKASSRSPTRTSTTAPARARTRSSSRSTPRTRSSRCSSTSSSSAATRWRSRPAGPICARSSSRISSRSTCRPRRCGSRAAARTTRRPRTTTASTASGSSGATC